AAHGGDAGVARPGPGGGPPGSARYGRARGPQHHPRDARLRAGLLHAVRNPARARGSLGRVSRAGVLLDPSKERPMANPRQSVDTRDILRMKPGTDPVVSCYLKL